MRQKRARGRAPDASTAQTKWNLATRQWALCEWFSPWLDAPFFAFNEFDDVVYSMGMEHLCSSGATRAEWNRLRAAMCNAFVGGHASPRRLSRAYLAMEARDLALYRADVRCVLRGQPLAQAIDPISGESLGPVWWTRYRFDPPVLPRPGAEVLVRTSGGHVLRAQFLALVDADRIRVLLPSGDEHDVLDFDVMLAPTICTADGLRVTQAASAVVAPDSSGMATGGLSTPPSARRPLFGSAGSVIPRTPLTLSGSISRATRINLFSDLSASGSGSMARLVSQSPRATLVSSPRVPGPLVSRVHHAPSASDEVEAEVDIGRLSELIRLHERKEIAVKALQRANNEAEEELNRGGTVARPETRAAAEASLATLSEINARLDVIAPAGFGPQEAPLDLPQPCTPRRHRVAQRLDAAFGIAGADMHPPPFITPESVKRPRISRISDGGGSSAGPQQPPLPSKLPLFDGRSDAKPMSGNGANSSRSGAAEGVDFTSAGGAVVLAKSLCKGGMAKLQDHPSFARLKASSAGTKAEIMECVSAVVAILIRGRATRDSAAVQELINALRMRFPRMPEAVNLAASLLEPTSSDSQ